MARQRIGEGMAVSLRHVLLNMVPSVLLLLCRPDLGGRHAAVRYNEEGESMLLPGGGTSVLLPTRLRRCWSLKCQWRARRTGE
jgi:hypothetical protein